MAEVLKTFTFDASIESWTGYPTTGDETMDRITSDGSPGAGCLRHRLDGKNKNPGASYFEWVGTWEDLGVPSGGTVTEIGTAPEADYNWRCSEYNVGSDGNSYAGPLEVYDNTPTLIGAFSSAQSGVSSTTSWATVDGSAVTIPNHSSTTTVRLRITSTLRTGNTSGAYVTLLYDQVTVRITYTSGVQSASQTMAGGALAGGAGAKVSSAVQTMGNGALGGGTMLELIRQPVFTMDGGGVAGGSATVAAEKSYSHVMTGGAVAGKVNQILLHHNPAVNNGGFETAGGGYPDVFSGWTEGYTGSSTVTDGTTEAHSGSHCAAIYTDASNNYVGVSQSILVAGSQYTVKLWLKKTEANTCSIHVGADSGAGWDYLDATQEWVQYTATGVATSDTFIIKRNSAADTHWFIDDVELYDVTPSVELEYKTSRTVAQAVEATSSIDRIGQYARSLIKQIVPAQAVGRLRALARDIGHIRPVSLTAFRARAIGRDLELKYLGDVGTTIAVDFSGYSNWQNMDGGDLGWDSKYGAAETASFTSYDGRAFGPVSDYDSAAIYKNADFDNDHYALATLRTSTVSIGDVVLGVGVRCDNNVQYGWYARGSLSAGPAEWLFRFPWLQLGFRSDHTYADGEVVRLTAEGSVLTAYSYSEGTRLSSSEGTRFGTWAGLTSWLHNQAIPPKAGGISYWEAHSLNEAPAGGGVMSFSVAQSVLQVIARSIAQIIRGVSSVKRVGQYFRGLAVILKSQELVDYLAERIRNAGGSRPVTFSVGRLRKVGRVVGHAVGMVFSAAHTFTQTVARTIAYVANSAFSVVRVGQFARLVNTLAHASGATVGRLAAAVGRTVQLVGNLAHSISASVGERIRSIGHDIIHGVSAVRSVAYSRLVNLLGSAVSSVGRLAGATARTISLARAQTQAVSRTVGLRLRSVTHGVRTLLAPSRLGEYIRNSALVGATLSVLSRVSAAARSIGLAVLSRATLSRGLFDRIRDARLYLSHSVNASRVGAYLRLAWTSVVSMSAVGRAIAFVRTASAKIAPTATVQRIVAIWTRTVVLVKPVGLALNHSIQGLIKVWAVITSLLSKQIFTMGNSERKDDYTSPTQKRQKEET